MINKKGVLKTFTTIIILISFMWLVAFPSQIKKDETVYGILDANGKPQSITSTNWIHSDKKGISVNDVSNLINVVNITGDEKPQINGKNIRWSIKGNDLFYQGQSKASLPVDISIEYYLNGKKINSSEIKNKSGHIKIVINASNRIWKSIKINNETRKICVPFSMLTLVNMPLDDFKNVKVNSGQIVSDGKNQAVISFLMPGLKESLKLDKDMESLFEMPQNIVIEADTSKFKIGSIMFAVVNKFPEINFDKFSSIDQMKDGINELMNASKKLLTGAIELSNAQNTYYINLIKFVDGLNKLNASGNEIYNGILDIKKGVLEAKTYVEKIASATASLDNNAQLLKNGIDKYNMGIREYTQGVYQFTYGAETLYNGISVIGQKNKELFNGINSSLEGAKQIVNGQMTLNNGIGSLKDGVNKIVEAKKKELDGINTLLESFQLLEQNIKPLLENPALKEQMTKLYQIILQQKQGVLELQSSSKVIIYYLESISNASSELANGSNSILESMKKLQTAFEQIYAGSNLINQNIDKIVIYGKALVDGGKMLNQSGNIILDSQKEIDKNLGLFTQGTKDLAKGIKEINNGFANLVQGAGELEKGFAVYKQGVNTLTSSAKKLQDGQKQITNASKEFKDGFIKFNNQGIKDLYSKTNDYFDEFINLKLILKNISAYSKEYKSFSGIAPNMKGEVKFILKTQEIK